MKREEPSKLRNPQPENRNFEFAFGKQKVVPCWKLWLYSRPREKVSCFGDALYPTQKSRVLRSIHHTIFIQTCAGHIRDIPLCVWNAKKVFAPEVLKLPRASKSKELCRFTSQKAGGLFLCEKLPPDVAGNFFYSELFLHLNAFSFFPDNGNGHPPNFRPLHFFFIAWRTVQRATHLMHSLFRVVWYGYQNRKKVTVHSRIPEKRPWSKKKMKDVQEIPQNFRSGPKVRKLLCFKPIGHDSPTPPSFLSLPDRSCIPESKVH